MYLTRGQPVVYYGDEQGFSAPKDVPGGIGDQRAREDMFPSKVALHNNTYDLIGTNATTADANFDTSHPLYKHIAGPGPAAGEAPGPGRRRAGPPLRHQGPRHLRLQPDGPDQQVEYVVAVNNADTEADGDVRDLPAGAQHAQGRLARVGPARPVQDRHRGTRHRDGPAAVGGGLQGQLEAARGPRRARCRRSSRPVRPASSPAAPRSASPARWRLHPGDLRLAARRDD